MKILFKVLIIFFTINIILLSKKTIALDTSNLNIKSQSAILLVPQNLSVIFEKNGYDKFYPASTTKVLTAIIALESLNLNEKVKISKKAAEVNGTTVGLHRDGYYTVEDLLYGLLLSSGNDCAIALAEHICGSEEKFAEIMNKKSKAIGTKYSNFVNASGLHHKNHYTCAYDLGKILSYAMNNKNFIEISTSQTHNILGTDGELFHISNQNQLLLRNGKYYYKHAILGKTGFTTPAQYTFVASAKNENIDLVAVALKAESKEEYLQDIINLFDYGFNKVRRVNITSKN